MDIPITTMEIEMQEKVGRLHLLNVNRFVNKPCEFIEGEYAHLDELPLGHPIRLITSVKSLPELDCTFVGLTNERTVIVIPFGHDFKPELGADDGGVVIHAENLISFGILR